MTAAHTPLPPANLSPRTGALWPQQLTRPEAKAHVKTVAFLDRLQSSGIVGIAVARVGVDKDAISLLSDTGPKQVALSLLNAGT